MSNSTDRVNSAQMVSVIMPAYNSEKFVAEAIESVLGQTYSNWELLAIDDGSTDATGEIIDSYAVRDARISAFHTENKGVSHARNVGLDNATGKWVAFLDSDDLMELDALANLLAVSDGMELVAGNYYEFPTLVQRLHYEDAYFFSRAELASAILRYKSAWGMIFRRGVICERFQQGLQYGEDTIFLYDFLMHCTHAATIHNFVYGYRRGEVNSLSHHVENISLAYVERCCSATGELLDDADAIYQAFVAHLFVISIKELVCTDNLAKAEESSRISEILESKYLREIPLMQLNLSSKEMHLFAILKTGDMALIENEFKHACKR